MKLFINILSLKGSLFIGFLFFWFSFIGQERFNVRYNSEFPNTIFTSLVESNGSYIVTGFVGDSVGISNGRPSLFVQFSGSGERMFQRSYGGNTNNSDAHLSSQNSDLVFLNDSVLINSGISFDEEWTRQGYFMKYNLEGDTIETHRFYSPYIEENYPLSNSIGTKRLELSGDGNILLLSNVIGEITGNDIMIQKITPEGEILWTYEYATAQDPDICDVVLPSEDGGGIFFPRILEESISLVRKLNSEGLLMWEFNTLFDEWNGRVRDAIIEDDLIIAASSWNDDSEFGVIPSVLKFDTLGNFLWHTPVWQNDYSPNHKGRQIVQSQNGGYVLGGIHYDSSVEPDDKSAFLAKVSEEGELLWQRRYKHLDLDFDDHELYDLRATSDGGYIFCGESEDRWPAQQLTEPPYQQGWLVKVDEHGCLVEDCHLSDTVSEIEVENKEYFKVGPIPASEYLNIYQAQQVSPLAVYELYDLQGKLVKSIPVVDVKTTLMVDITDLPSGNYVLSLREGDKLIQSKKVTIR